MFGSLFLKECKAISKSIIYFVFIAVVVLFYLSQLGGGVSNNIEHYNDPTSTTEFNLNPLVKPLPNQEFYGTKRAEIPEKIIPNTIIYLINETKNNTFLTYPFGYGKKVTLNKSNLKKVKAIVEDLTDISFDDCRILLYGNVVNQDTYEKSVSDFTETIKDCCDYETFKTKMRDVEKLVGKGTEYSPQSYKDRSTMDLTYEEALKEYNDFIYKDKVTGAYAREFCDYMGLVISIFSIFVTVSFLRRDRKSKMGELISSRKASSTKIMLSRYLACVVMMILPIIVLSLFPTCELINYGIKHNISVNSFAYLTHIITWILPTLMVTTSVGFLFTILTDTPIGILFQFIWSFIFDMTDYSNYTIGGGHYGNQLTIRFNTLGNYQLYKDNISVLFINRVCYSILAIVLFIITIFIYEQKRKGKINVGGKLHKIFKHNKSSDKTVGKE